MENNFEDFEKIDLSSLDEMINSFPDLGENETIEDNDITDSIEGAQELDESTQEVKTEEPSSQEIETSSPLTPYAKMLVEEGLLPNIDLEKFDGSVDSLLEAQRQYDLQRFESFKEST